MNDSGNGPQAKAPIVARLADLFKGSESAHGTHGEPYWNPKKNKWEIKKTAVTLKEPPTLELWQQHVEGKRPLGVVPLRDDDTALWGTIDIDKYEADHADIIRRVQPLPLVPCRSKSGGLHLWRFYDKPTPAAAVRAELATYRARLKLNGAEIFPKSDNMWIIAPYFGSTYDGKIKEQVGLTAKGTEMSPAAFVRTAEDKRGPIAGGADDGPFAGAPACLREAALEGVPDGARNNWMFNLAVYARKRYGDERWKSKAADYNEEYLRPPLTDDELNSVLRQIDKKEYSYARKTGTVCENCPKPECYGQYGVGGRDGEYPVFQDVVIMMGDETIWKITLGDGREISVNSDDVYSQVRFGRACLAKLHTLFQKVKEPEWAKIINEASSRATVVQADMGVSLEDQFLELLTTFLTNRARGTSIEDLIVGRPWEDDDKKVHYFKMKSLVHFLKREGAEPFVRYSKIKLGNLVRGWSGGTDFLNIKGRGVNVYWVPSKIITPTVRVTIPPVPGVPI